MKNKTLTDEELSLLSQKGDEDAENILLSRFKEVVAKIARHYFLVGGDMEDLMQEGMIGLCKAIRKYSPMQNTSFKSFASLLIHRQIQSAIRHANTKKNETLSTADSITGEEGDISEELLASDEVLPIEKLIEKEEYENLTAVIKQSLSKKEYKVLMLYLDGQRYDEIAQNMQISVKSVDNALSRIKQKLRFLLK